MQPTALVSCVLLLLLPTGQADGPGGHHHGAHHGDHGAGHHGDHGAAHHGDHGAAHHGDHGAAHDSAGHHGDHGAVDEAPEGQQQVHHVVHSNVQRPVSASFSLQPEVPRSSGPARAVVEEAGGIQDLASLVATHPKLTTLKAAVEAAGLQDTLASSGPFTVFAPTNLAFKKLPEGEVARLLGDRARLSKLLLRHLVPGTTMQGKNIPPGVTHLKTAGGDQITTTRDKFIQIKSKKASAYVVLFDVLASNGVLHAVDTVF